MARRMPPDPNHRSPNRPARPSDRRVLLAASAALIVLVAGFAFVTRSPARPTGTPGPGTSITPSASPSGAVSPSSSLGGSSASPTTSVPPAADSGYLTNLTELRQRAAAAAQGTEPQATALAGLDSFAKAAVSTAPHPEQTIRIEGTEGPLLTDSNLAYALALAWGISGDAAEGRHSRDIVMAWVGSAKATEGTCPTGGECQTSLIVSRAAPAFVFAVDLLRSDPSVWSAADDAAFRSWLRSVILPSASDRANNWGDAGTMLRFVVSDYLNDQAGMNAAIGLWKGRLDLITSEGEIPEETRRGTAGMQYTQEALMYKVAVAWFAERRGIDLWDLKGKKGGTLKAALDLLADYWVHPEDWPWNANVQRPDPSPMWELAYAHWQDPAYGPIVQSGRPYGADGHSAIRWTTLTNGLPLASG
jgi:hypothetical protein